MERLWRTLEALLNRKARTRAGWFVRPPVLIIVGFWAACFPNSWKDNGTKVAGDGVGYYCYVRSFVQHGDFRIDPADRVPTENNDASQRLQQQYVEGHEHHESGRVYSQYGVGLSLFWLPVEEITHVGMITLRWLGATTLPADGFSWPYRYAVGLATALGGLAGLLMSFAIAESMVGAPYALMGILAGFFGSPLFHYTFYECSMSECPTFFAVTWSFWLWWRLRSSATVADWLLWGAAIGLATIMRYPNGVLMLMPLYEYSARALRRLRAGQSVLARQTRQDHLRGIAALVGFGALCLIQVLVWRASYGHWSPPHYATGIETWTKFSPGNVLWSVRKGLFTTHPLWLFGMIALPFVYRRAPKLIMGLLLMFGFMVWLNQLPFDFWGSHGYGARRFVPVSLCILVGLPLGLRWLLARDSAILRIAGSVIVLAFVWLALRSRSAMMNNPGLAEFGETPIERLSFELKSRTKGFHRTRSALDSLIQSELPEMNLLARFGRTHSLFVDNPVDLNAQSVTGRITIMSTSERFGTIATPRSNVLPGVGLVIGDLPTTINLNFCRSPNVEDVILEVYSMDERSTKVMISTHDDLPDSFVLRKGSTKIQLHGRGGAWKMGANTMSFQALHRVILRSVTITQRPIAN